jgi:hypothetical protein
MDHTEAIRLTAAERYLLDELSPEQREQFEEHFFDCAECALDLRAASMFIQQSKRVLAEEQQTAAPGLQLGKVKAGWRGWFRPAFLIPVFALLLAVIAYQGTVMSRHPAIAVDNPQVVPWTTINTRTRGTITPIIRVARGKGFLLFLSIPPDRRYSRYVAELYNPGGKREWSLTIEGKPDQDSFAVQIPPKEREAGTYSMSLLGVIDNQTKEIGRSSFELQIEN